MPSPYEDGDFLRHQTEPISRGRKGSVVEEQYMKGERIPKDGILADSYPTNEEVAKAVQQKVAASAYKSGDVVQTLKKAFMPEDGSSSMTFKSEDEVLNYIGQKVLLPIWKDPVCGDGNCEWPWEFPAWGRFGCKADCGTNPNTTNIVVNVRADFTGHPSIAPRVLMGNAAWNLCLEDDARRKRGEADLCWYDQDQSFESVQMNSINAASVIDGKWYVVIKGDYAGRVSGFIYDISNSSNPILVSTSPSWTRCQLTQPRTVSSTQLAVRRLMQAYTQANQVGGEEGQRILNTAVEEIQAMPGLEHLKTMGLGLSHASQQQEQGGVLQEGPTGSEPSLHQGVAGTESKLRNGRASDSL